MPPRKPAAKPAARKAAPRRSRAAASAWSEISTALGALWRPLWRLVAGGVAQTAAAAIVSLVVCGAVLVGTGRGCSVPINPFGPATTIEARAAQLATQHGFTSDERFGAGTIFRKVAEQIRAGGHTSAVTVDAQTRGSLANLFGPRWASAGQPWLDAMAQSWKGRFRPDSPPNEYEPIWREIASGLGIR